MALPSLSYYSAAALQMDQEIPQAISTYMHDGSMCKATNKGRQTHGRSSD
jgi:hypothetical protein